MFLATMKPLGKRIIYTIALVILCLSMSIGGTFSWFTDEVTTTGNVVSSGTLKAELYHTNPTDTDEQVTTDTKLFDVLSSGLWEPGAVAYENFTVKNAGSLAFEYVMDLAVDQETVVNSHRLSEAIRYAIVPGGVDTSSRNAAILSGTNSANGWHALSELAVDSGSRYLEPGQSESIGMVLYWEPTANDNNFNMKDENRGKILELQASVHLNATQWTFESDSFGNTYDQNAEFGHTVTTVSNAQGIFSVSANNKAISASGETAQAGTPVTMTITDGAPSESILSIVQDNQTILSYDIRVEGQQPGSLVKIQLQLERGLTDVSVFNESQKMQTAGATPVADTFSYSAATGVLTVYVNHYGTFSFVYTRPGHQPAVPETPASDFIWTKADEGVTITGYIGKDSRVRVPQTIDGAAVVRIGENAFAENEKITSIILPESITSIGKKAFYQCNSLETMDVAK